MRGWERMKSSSDCHSNSAYGSAELPFATVLHGDDFHAQNLTFQNDYSQSMRFQAQGSQAIRAFNTADRAVFRNVRFLARKTRFGREPLL